MNNKLVPIAVLVGAVLIGGVLLFSGKSAPQASGGAANNVSMVDGKQVI